MYCTSRAARELDAAVVGPDDAGAAAAGCAAAAGAGHGTVLWLPAVWLSIAMAA